MVDIKVLKKKEKLVKQLLKLENKNFEDWYNEKLQTVIDENVDTIVSLLSQ